MDQSVREIFSAIEIRKNRWTIKFEGCLKISGVEKRRREISATDSGSFNWIDVDWCVQSGSLNSCKPNVSLLGFVLNLFAYFTWMENFFWH